MARDLYGFFLLIVLVVGVSVFLVSFLLKKRLKAISEQWEAAARKKLGPNDIKRREREQDRQMIRLRPKLEIIQRRLYYPDEEEKVEESYFHDHHRRLPGMDEEEGIISSEGYAERLIALPAGRVGIRFNKGISPPEIAGTKPTCKVARKVHVGDIVTALILPNGTVVEDFTPNELLDHLARHVSSEGRKLIVLRYDKKHNQAARRSQTAGHKNEQPEGPRSGGYNGSIAAAGMQISQENITFDAERFFDTLDVNGDGVLSYEELNRILRLRPSELHDFIRRMNILDDERDEHHVTKDTFVLYFLDVLDETSNFRLTEGEAGARWDEIADLFGTNSNEEIKLDNIYGSSISAFLSDVQINDLIQKMKKAKLASGSSGRSRKLITDKSRYQIFGGPQATEYVGRSLFTTHYPRILNEILIQAAQGPDPRKQRGIDIAFKDLRLLVKGRNAVLDKVTGRLHKGAMTAILGGSGAGKTSLLNALCGRAYYGEVTGDIFINGSKAAMEDLNTVGFVPQVR
jgi:Ca2+-binding EF-hand superfamily protein